MIIENIAMHTHVLPTFLKFVIQVCCSVCGLKSLDPQNFIQADILIIIAPNDK